MRVERRGAVEPLTPRLVRYLVEALGGKSLDELVHPEERKADYVCLNGLLAVELKTLEDDGSVRMGNLNEDLRQREDFPFFYGAVPFDAIVENMDEPEKIRKKALERIGRPIKDSLSQANDQLAAHRLKFPRKNLVRMMLIANEDHALFDPQTMAHVLQPTLLRLVDGAPRYPDIDVIVYMSERHATAVNGQIALPILVVEGHAFGKAPWKSLVVDHFLQRWSEWQAHPLYSVEGVATKFTTIEHIPESMRRQEMWELNYRRNPYLQHLTFDELRDWFDETVLLSMLGMVRGCPVKPPREVAMHGFEPWAHFMIEVGRRSLPMDRFPQTLERQIAAAQRLNLPDSIADWLRALEADRDNRAA
jgi:hypothetical protein